MNLTIVNAWLLHKIIQKQNNSFMSMIDFREEFDLFLCKIRISLPSKHGRPINDIQEGTIKKKKNEYQNKTTCSTEKHKN